MKTRHIPPGVRDAMRAVHRLVVHRRPYEEVAAALDTAAVLSEAADPNAAELIALERLDAVTRYPVGDGEVERVLDAAAAVLAAMPAAERAWQIGNACWGRPALALRHLVPLLAELERTSPEDEKTLESLRRQISIVRGEPQPPEEDEEGDEGAEDLESSPKFPEDFIAGIRYALRHQRMGWPYEDVRAIFDAVAELPSAAAYPDQLSHDRIIAARLSERPDEDLEREIERALETGTGPAWSRASTIMLACDGRPVLAEKYMPALIAEAEDELRERPDEVAQKYLDGVKDCLEQTRREGQPGAG
jgi:hypothetical protein